jgi:uncharacterized membrane protein YdjX (TVP38/TMEM64 family)
MNDLNAGDVVNQLPNQSKKKNFLTYFYSILPIVVLALIAFFVFRKYPELPKIFIDSQKVRAFISQFGMRAPIIFISMQVFQIIFAPIPGYVIELVSGYIFGAVKGTIFCISGVLIGSTIAFWVGRIFGRNLLQIFVPKDKMHKFDEYIVHKGPFIIFLLLLFTPLGDITYYLSGLTPIPYLIYILMVFIARLPMNIVYNVVGSKAFSLSTQEWIILIVILGILALLFYLNRKRIEKLMLRFAKIE